jgi:DNA-binding response OmpR family regulator
MDERPAMDKTTTILVIDDDIFMREILEDVLSEHYRVITAEGGAEGVACAQAEHPALILLDVEMPDQDGYETCRQLKQLEDTALIPVIFVSARDKIEERLIGYEAGGNDYVIKPFDKQELTAKIEHLLEMVADRVRFEEMASMASSTAMTAMTSMSEMGALLESLNHFNASADIHALAKAVLAGLASYGLNCAVQIRSPEQVISLSGHGEASPLEISVMDHMTEMDRIVHFKTRMSIHYPHVAMLVNNMPVEDPDRCGRLRDHLAMLVEGAEMRAAGLIAENESKRRGQAIERMIARVSGTLGEIDSTQRRNRTEIRAAFAALTDKMGDALLRMGLTNEHEELLCEIVSQGIENVIKLQTTDAQLQNKLTDIVGEMKEILA